MKPRVEHIGDATLYLGDCLEILPTLGKVDAVVTDPPYGVAHRSNHIAESTTAEWVRGMIRGDNDTSMRDAVIEWCIGRPIGIGWAVFGSWKRPRPRGTKAVLIWDKGPASGMGDLSFPWKLSWEEIYIGGNGWSGNRDEGVITGHWVVTRASMGRVHPNEKPVSLIEYLLIKSPQSEIVIDPFMGSGTTGVACANLGRSFIGIEIEEKYFDIACKRIEDAYKQPRLFDDPKPVPEQGRLLDPEVGHAE